MFYIKRYFPVAVHFPFWFSWNLFLLIAFFFCVMSWGSLEKSLISGWKQNKDSGSSPHFYALMATSISKDTLVQNLIRLPGVKKVEVKNTTDLREKAKKYLNEIGFSMSSHLLKEQYLGIKVLLQADVKNSAILLIKEYLERISGKGELAFGPVKGSEQSASLHGAKSSFSWFDLRIILFIPLLFSFWSLGFLSNKLQGLCFYLNFLGKRNRILVFNQIGLIAVAYGIAILVSLYRPVVFRLSDWWISLGVLSAVIAFIIIKGWRSCIK